MIEMLRRAWCNAFHGKTGWPTGEFYRCPVCWIQHPVPWHVNFGKLKNARRGSLVLARLRAVWGRIDA
jgi:hypothetical protein